VNHAALAARVRRIAHELAALAEALESEERLQPSPRLAKPRKPRWVGPVPPEIRGERQDAWGARNGLCMALGLDPTRKYFAMVHNLFRGVPPPVFDQEVIQRLGGKAMTEITQHLAEQIHRYRLHHRVRAVIDTHYDRAGVEKSA
jgi:hypothetical protein